MFSLGCVFLEIITFMLKKKSHDLVKHRSSKQKISTGGKTSRTDSSYHANLDKIETWIEVLEKASFEHDDDAFRALPPILNLVRGMLSRAPAVRPTARDTRDRLLDILLSETAIPDIHCGAHKHDDVGVAISPSSSRRASSITSLRTMSTMSSSSDTDTIRYSTSSNATSVSTILNSYSDRATLSGISEDDGDSIRTVGGSKPLYVDTAYESPRKAPSPPSSPISPRTTRPRTMSSSTDRSISPSRLNKSWSKPFLLLP
jgi:hypothetical protein